MALSSTEADQIKDHLLKQLDNFPEDKRDQIREQISAMSPSDVENFVKQNDGLNHLGGQCIVCAIASRQVNSFEVAEDDKNLAVLEINPLSKGHTIVFPKTHTDSISSKTRDLANLSADKLKRHFSPKKIQVNETKIMDHPVLEVIPIFGDETERKQATPQELSAVQAGLSQPVPKKVEQTPEQKTPPKPEPLPKIKPRMP